MSQNKCCNKEKCCVDLVICILSSLLKFVAGLLIGALTGLVTALGIGAIIAITTLLLILLVLRIINILCCRAKEKKDCCCYNDYDKYC